MSHGVRWVETGVVEERERDGGRREEGGIIMVGGCQSERAREREERGERSRGRERKTRARRERESPAHSGKTIQLVSEGAFTTERERER